MISNSKYFRTSLLEVLNQNSIELEEKIAYRFLKDGESVSDEISYADLALYAAAIGLELRKRNYAGERALLLYPSGIEYIKAFFACLSSEVIAVPAYPPRINRSLNRIVSIVEDSGSIVVLTTSDLLKKLKVLASEIPALDGLTWIATDQIALGAKNKKLNLPDLKLNDLAYLQYTSGSTGKPKGVMITHGNVLHNSEYIHRIHNTSRDMISMTWLPIYHDMGLIDGILQPFYCGATAYIMPPVAFLQRPVRWLNAISRYKVTHSGGPNFSYDLCVDKIRQDELNGVDLSSWRNAYIGAEKIWKSTIENFVQKFHTYGFREEFFHPCYGLAEATLVTTGGIYGELPRYFQPNMLIDSVVDKFNGLDQLGEADFLVGNGMAYDGMDIKIVCPNTFRLCTEKEVGEIWINGSSVAKGYWDNEELTNETFFAHLSPEDGCQYLRSGDLGFIEGSDLFFTGRLKELIIVRGQNYYPYDFERIIQDSVDGVRRNAGAAFSIYLENIEKIIVIQEIERTYIRKINTDAVVNKIRKIIWNEMQLQVYDVLLVKPNVLPRTSSGKIQRNLAKKFYLEGNIDILASKIIEKK